MSTWDILILVVVCLVCATIIVSVDAWLWRKRDKKNKQWIYDHVTNKEGDG